MPEKKEVLAEYITVDELNDKVLAKLDRLNKERRKFLKHQGWDGKQPILYTPHTMDTPKIIESLVEFTIYNDPRFKKSFVEFPGSKHGELYQKAKKATATAAA